MDKYKKTGEKDFTNQPEAFDNRKFFADNIEIQDETLYKNGKVTVWVRFYNVDQNGKEWDEADPVPFTFDAPGKSHSRTDAENKILNLPQLKDATKL